MIIRCRKCETRFRFDESVMDGDGAWVRCSRCQNVFFQKKPSAGPTAAAAAVQEATSVRISDANPPLDDHRFPVGEERPLSNARQVGKEPEQRGVTEKIEGETGRQKIQETMPETLSEEPLYDADWGEPVEVEEENLQPTPRDGGWGMGTIVKTLALTLFILLVVGGGYLWWFPEARHQVLEWGSPWLWSVPGMEQLLGTEEIAKKKRTTLAASVALKDIQLRSVTNLQAGTLRVVEGVAVNQSSAPLAKISVLLVNSDADNIVLDEKTVFCGNLLTDEELSILTESEIQRELSIPQGSDTPNDRIPPGGEISFMIVFGQEQIGTGTTKAIVRTAGADMAQQAQ